MEIEITNFFGLDLTKEPNESWILEKDGLRRRRRRKNSPLLYCSYDKNSNSIVVILSKSVQDDLNLLFRGSTTEDINNQSYLVIDECGYKFITCETLLNYEMVIIKKVS